MTDEVFDVESIDVDIDAMTLGEMELVEELTGLGLDEIGVVMTKPGPKTKVLIALAYVVKRRTSPDITLEQVKSMRVALADSDPKAPAVTSEPPVSASLPASPFVPSIAV